MVKNKKRFRKDKDKDKDKGKDKSKEKKITALKSKSKVRPYNNIQRTAKSAQNEKNIVESLVALLVECRGGEVSIAKVAQRAGITQRTVFRFFKDKATLYQAINSYLQTYLSASVEQMQTLSFVGFAKNAFYLFDQHESLTLAYLFSPFGQETRTLFRKKLNQMMMDKIVKEKNIVLSPKIKKRLEFITALVNAKIWSDLKTDYNSTGEEMANSVDWALNALLEKIEK